MPLGHTRKIKQTAPKTSTKEKYKPTNQAKDHGDSFPLLADFGLKLHRSALSKFYCKPSQEEWLNTPEEGNEEGRFYKGGLIFFEEDGGCGFTEVDLTRDEYVELKEHLAFLRRIRPYEKPQRRQQ
jgi:hypothetical protein